MGEKNRVKVLFNEVKYLVSDYSELSDQEILSSNREECVDARYIMVGVLTDYLTDDEIARFSGLTRACCNKIRNGMRAKLNRFSFRCLYNSVKGAVKEWYETNLQQTSNELTTNILTRNGNIKTFGM